MDMEALVKAAAELRRRVQMEVPEVTEIRCDLVITEGKLMLQPTDLRSQLGKVWIYTREPSEMSVIVADCPDE